MGWTSAVARQVVIEGDTPSSGLFIYSGAPGHGDLAESAAAFNGVDPYGNSYPAGYASFVVGGGGSAQLDAGTVIVTDAAAHSWALFAFLPAATPYLAFTGPANGTPVLYMNSAGQLIANDPATLETLEAWHDMRPLLVGGFTAAAGDYPPQYRLNALGRVEIWGSLNLPAAYNAVTFATLPAAYVPAAHTQRYPVVYQAGAAPAASVRVQCATTGALQLQGLPAGAAGTSVWIGGEFPLDDTGLITV